MSDLLKSALVALLLVLLALALNAGVFGASWRWDDTQILLHAHQYSIWQDFTRPEVWQQFSPANLTPLLILSFEVDLILFGLNPVAFYLHQVLALAAGAFMLFMCLRLWCDNFFAIVGSVLFLAGLPVMLVAEQLMTRHYAEGLVLALLALYGFVRHLRTGQRSALVLAVIMYALACTAKEVYVPLPALLLFLPEGGTRRRIRAVLPFFAVTVFYALWRFYMLSSLSGGYADSSSYLSAAFIAQVLQSFAGFPALLIGPRWPLAIFLYLALLVGYLFIRRRTSWLSLLTMALVLLPLAPLVSSPGITLADRYLFVVWAALSYSIAYIANTVCLSVLDHNGRPLAAAVLTVVPLLLILVLWQSVPVRQTLADVGKEFDVQGEFIWQQDASVGFVPSGNVLPAFWFVTGMRDFKAGLGAGTSPQPVVDDWYLADSGVDRLFIWQRDCECMADISAQVPQRLAEVESGLRAEAPLTLRYAYQGGYFSWEFGPYPAGTYHVVSDVVGVIPAPPAGQLRATLADNAPFYLRYTSPEGWFTYSELQHIVRDGPEVTWSRE